ncbi:MAG: glycosyltransferase family 4 protein [Betaproteobacteria bacterium]|nr:glycosyltransferase family 4 protein [Betaproteobacteria bacterium]
MRIAQIAPLYESIPPKLYGGTERVVSYLTEALVKLGHEVTLFASGDSQTRARLRPGTPRAIRLDPQAWDPFAPHVLMLQQVCNERDNFDVLHFHIDYLHFPLSRAMGWPGLTTLHGRLDLPELVPLYREFTDMPLVSISNAQRTPLSWANWQATIYHGLPLDLYTPQAERGHYLAFLGRISPEKGIDRAIEIAQRAGVPLKIAAKVDRVDRDYFEEKIKPLLAQPGIEYIGELGERDKDRFLGQALALLFPIDWPEPFGLAVIEANACGTPVVAFRRGSIPEIIENGVSGFVVDNAEEAVVAVEQASSLDRRACRTVFEQRFAVERMAREYVAVYERLLTPETQSKLAPVPWRTTNPQQPMA